MTPGARVAIVTGATGAIGSATARRLVAAGWAVAVVGRDGLAAFLVSTDAAWITGQVIAVDGGLSGVKLPPMANGG